MARFIIRGGRTIAGELTPAGNKNAALPMLSAALLTDQPVTLRNVPLINDVRTSLEILDDLGASVSLKGHSVTVCAASLRKQRVDPALCRKARSSVLFAGPLCARYGHAVLFPPGGDVIGRRRLDTHIDGFKALGIRARCTDRYEFRAASLHGGKVLLDEASVTATENIIMAAVLARGKTSIFNAACEPHVQDLCRLLNSMGARISGVGTNLLHIDGVPALRGADHRVAPDHIEIASFIAACALTGGALSVKDFVAEDFAVIGRAFAKLGLKLKIGGGRLLLPARQILRVQDDLGAAIPKIEDGTWPGFPSDLLSAAIVLATQARGTILFFEKMFESRMYFVDRLIEMGARIVQCDPHRVVVSGPARLHASHMSGPDIRAGMALLLAALCADGESVVDNAQIIDRGYERIEVRLRKLGADISRVG